jgi:putative transcriptional regulator
MKSVDVKSLRRSLSLTQEQLAKALGVSWATINRWERHKTRPSPLALEKLNRFIAQNSEVKNRTAKG